MSLQAAITAFFERTTRRRQATWLVVLALLLTTLQSGCGTTKSFEATEQLILSDAVDDSISAIDFRPLGGFKVFLDTQYLKNFKGHPIVNADYVTSALRQQATSAGCLLQDAMADADIVIEARVGTLGSDAFQVTYGVPSNSALASAAAAIPTVPSIPIIPELSLARRESREGAAKIAAFAYDRVTRQPVWQSGIVRSSSTARDTWVMGIGPIQTGTARTSTRLIGSGLEFGNATVEGGTPRNLFERPPVNYSAEVRFENGVPIVGPRLANEGMLRSSISDQQSAMPAPATTPAEAASEPAAQVAEQK